MSLFMPLVTENKFDGGNKFLNESQLLTGVYYSHEVKRLSSEKIIIHQQDLSL